MSSIAHPPSWRELPDGDWRQPCAISTQRFFVSPEPERVTAVAKELLGKDRKK